MQTIFNFKDEPKFCSGWSTWPSEARPAHISVAPPIGKAGYGPGTLAIYFVVIIISLANIK